MNKSLEIFQEEINNELNYKKERYDEWIKLREYTYHMRDKYKPIFKGFFRIKVICPICNNILNEEIVKELHWSTGFPFLDGSIYFIIYSCNSCDYKYAHAGGTGGD